MATTRHQPKEDVNREGYGGKTQLEVLDEEEAKEEEKRAGKQKANDSTDGRNILMFTDGTSNNALNINKEKTNVYRLFKCIAPTDSIGRKQLAFYQQGIGTTPEFQGGVFKGLYKGWDSATGNGITLNVTILYYILCEMWAEGDKLFLFGFSRGGYTARILASLVADCGMLDFEDSKTAKEKFADATKLVDKWTSAKGDVSHSPDLQKLTKASRIVKSVEVVGVWDTVASLGVVDLWAADFQSEKYKFAESLRQRFEVENVFQAIALTEHRNQFKPVIWKDITKNGKQCWFLGHHTAVGGGIKQTAINIPDLSLLWMAAQVNDLLGIDEKVLDGYTMRKIPAGTERTDIIDSSKGVYPYTGDEVREQYIGATATSGTSKGNDFIHISVRDWETLTTLKTRGKPFDTVLNPKPQTGAKHTVWLTAKGARKVAEDTPNEFEARKLDELRKSLSEIAVEEVTEEEEPVPSTSKVKNRDGSKSNVVGSRDKDVEPKTRPQDDVEDEAEEAATKRVKAPPKKLKKLNPVAASEAPAKKKATPKKQYKFKAEE